MAEKVEIQENPSVPGPTYGDYGYRPGETYQRPSSVGSVAPAETPGPTYGDYGYRPGETYHQPSSVGSAAPAAGSTSGANLSNLGSSGGNDYTAPVDTGAYDFSKVSLTPMIVGGKTVYDMSKMNLPTGIDIRDYTISSVQNKDGTYESTMVRLPEGEASKGMSRFTSLDPVTRYATYGKPETPEAPEASVAQSLYKSPQFMAPVTASVVNGLFQMLISERMAKAQRDEQRRMLDAQFQVLEKKEEANEEKRRQFASIYASLRERRKGGG